MRHFRGIAWSANYEECVDCPRTSSTRVAGTCDPGASRYNKCLGGWAPARRVRGSGFLSCLESTTRSSSRGAVMTYLSGPLDTVNLVALSLLPVSWWRSFGERLRAGDTPGYIFDRLLAERCPAEPGKPTALRSNAAAALARAA